MTGRIIIAAISSIALNSCFTGIESTPRITADDVKREHIVTTPEMKFLADISAEPPARWSAGKRFFITDDRIRLALAMPQGSDSLHLAGHTMEYTGMDTVNAITGGQVAVLSFVTDQGTHVSYRTDRTPEQIQTAQALDIPFAIEMSVVEQAARRLKGNRYYIVTPIWYDAAGRQLVEGLRHVPVDVVDVVPGDHVYPLRVIFTANLTNEREKSDTAGTYSVYMTIGDKRTSTRNFDRLLAFENPRLLHPHITDEVWQLIIHSKVRAGMTKDECRLALGYPDTTGQRPTTSGMVEYWSYADGKVLIFDEGLLSSFRR